MCAACGVPGHLAGAVPDSEPTALPPTSRPRKFAALRNRDCRPYLVGTGLAMMADNIEDMADNASTENASDMMENQADAMRATGQNQAEDVRTNDMDTNLANGM